MRFEPGGKVTKSHFESRKIWYKPWTWLRKPVRVITEMEASHFYIIPVPADRDSIVSLMEFNQKRICDVFGVPPHVLKGDDNGLEK